MLTFGNERIIQQGEPWTLDITLSQSYQEYIPFIISSERHNPKILVSVASTKYEKIDRYVTFWWLDISHIPKFYQTVPDTTTFGEVASNVPISLPVGDRPFEKLYQYTKVEDEIDETLGHKPYYYVYFDNTNNPHFDYKCDIILHITGEETNNWNSQNYVYQITLVDTISMVDHIQDARIQYPELDWPITDDIEILYDFIKLNIPNWFQEEIDKWFQEEIDKNLAIGKTSNPQVILAPTKLQVNTNIII